MTEDRERLYLLQKCKDDLFEQSHDSIEIMGNQNVKSYMLSREDGTEFLFRGKKYQKYKGQIKEMEVG